MLDLECKRDEALAEYKEALAVRDGQLDTRLAAERGVKAAYVQRGHEHDCDDDAGDDAPGRRRQPSPASQHRSAGRKAEAAMIPESRAMLRGRMRIHAESRMSPIH